MEHGDFGGIGIREENREVEQQNPNAGAANGDRERPVSPLRPVSVPDTVYNKLVLPVGPELDLDPDFAAGIVPTFCLGKIPAIRMAYLQAVLNNVKNHLSVAATSENLSITLSCIQSTGALSDGSPPVQTLASAKKRLRIDPDSCIIQYAILLKILPQVSLIHSLHRMVCRKGFRKLICDLHNTPENQNNDPDFVMNDIYNGTMWHQLKTGIKCEVRNHGNVRDVPRTEGLEQKLTEHCFRLHLTINLDWFGAYSGRPHSAGPMYIINDLAHNIRFLQFWVQFVGVSLQDQQNQQRNSLSLSEPTVERLICSNCDTPGARKASGLAGHSHDLHSCAWCRCTLDVNKPTGYIAETFDWIPGWRPSKQTVLDFMHAIYLGANCTNSAKQHFEDAINSIQWPTHITRLPKNLGQKQSLKKADKWRRLLTVTPIILWCAWRNPNDTIPDTEPPVLSNEQIKTTHSRRRLSLYNAVLYLCVAVQLLSTKKISMSQANIGQTYFAHYCLSLLRLGVTLIINHQLAMHFSTMIKMFGPVYGWWLFAFERFNGVLEKVKLNGHDGGQVELTMLRNWVTSHLIYEYLLALPADASAEEHELVDLIIKAEAAKSHNSVMTEIFRSKVSDDYNSRIPVRIEDLLVIQIPDTDCKPHVCAVVRKLGVTEGVPPMPWDLYAMVLEIHTSFASDLGPLKVIPAADIDCPLALVPVFHYTAQ
ncbi:hypothetical protein BDP27DRAFT_1385475 [Rhodocollybia butyracea]|uniref:Uncharacterized protein n=1 Tax=Rhodocollybia butyracea TaxID=206335 RepID=A0A9P5TYR7_9AGAR|nr:hypothetical protein BDP27DRAFT_1385475 [Rhodocollybia butyracea]